MASDSQDRGDRAASDSSVATGSEPLSAPAPPSRLVPEFKLPTPDEKDPEFVELDVAEAPSARKGGLFGRRRKAPAVEMPKVSTDPFSGLEVPEIEEQFILSPPPPALIEERTDVASAEAELPSVSPDPFALEPVATPASGETEAEPEAAIAAAASEAAAAFALAPAAEAEAPTPTKRKRRFRRGREQALWPKSARRRRKREAHALDALAAPEELAAPAVAESAAPASGLSMDRTATSARPAAVTPEVVDVSEERPAKRRFGKRKAAPTTETGEERRPLPPLHLKAKKEKKRGLRRRGQEPGTATPTAPGAGALALPEAPTPLPALHLKAKKEKKRGLRRKGQAAPVAEPAGPGAGALALPEATAAESLSPSRKEKREKRRLFGRQSKEAVTPTAPGPGALGPASEPGSLPPLHLKEQKAKRGLFRREPQAAVPVSIETTPPEPAASEEESARSMRGARRDLAPDREAPVVIDASARPKRSLFRSKEEAPAPALAETKEKRGRGWRRRRAEALPDAPATEEVLAAREALGAPVAKKRPKRALFGRRQGVVEESPPLAIPPIVIDSGDNDEEVLVPPVWRHQEVEESEEAEPGAPGEKVEPLAAGASLEGVVPLFAEPAEIDAEGEDDLTLAEEAEVEELGEPARGEPVTPLWPGLSLREQAARERVLEPYAPAPLMAPEGFPAAEVVEPVAVGPPPVRSHWVRERRAYIVLLLLAFAFLGLMWALALQKDAAPTSAPTTTPVIATVAVANVVGQTEEEARAALEGQGLMVTQGESEAAEPAGTVVAQDPAAGIRLEKGDTVQLTVSSGPPTVVVPKLIGLSEAEARAELEDLGLMIESRTIIAANKVGKVVRQSPAAGEESKEGLVVVVFIGKVHPPVKIPDLAGKTLKQARTRLSDLGFTVTVRYQQNDAAKGTVLALAPAPGTKAAYKSSVKLTVSSGPPPVPANGAVAFAATRGGEEDSDIYRVEPDGGGVVNLTDNSVDDGHPSWSPDGKRLAFESARGGVWDIYTMAANGKERKRLTDTRRADRDPSWSPDGKSIAFSSRRKGAYNLVVMNADGSRQRVLLAGENDHRYPSWSPDGKSIAFVGVVNGNQDIYVVSASGQNPKRVVKGAAVDTAPAWSPDGSRLVFSSARAGDFELYSVLLASGKLTRLTKAAGDDLAPSYAPNGKRIIFAATRRGRQGLYSMRPDGTDVKLLIRNGLEPAWQPVPRT